TSTGYRHFWRTTVCATRQSARTNTLEIFLLKDNPNMNIKKKVLSFGALLTAGLLTLTACGGDNGSGDAASDSEELVPVTIAIPTSINGLGPLTALELGFFEEAGVDVTIERIQSGAEGAA